MKEIKIALLGLGTVGSGVVKVLQSHGAEMSERAGCRLALGRVADADLTRPREGLDLARLPLTSDANQAIDDPAVQIVIELIGGLEPARTFILKA
ncbi:MAG TPA: homoserine dehydrogenase, partial [Methylomirabilota bacterium]|nr:homoserine dehydrogenase [Methylomirabilota bacterium]